MYVSPAFFLYKVPYPKLKRQLLRSLRFPLFSLTLSGSAALLMFVSASLSLVHIRIPFTVEENCEKFPPLAAQLLTIETSLHQLPPSALSMCECNFYSPTPTLIAFGEIWRCYYSLQSLFASINHVISAFLRRISLPPEYKNAKKYPL